MATLAFTIQADDTVLLVDDETGFPTTAAGLDDDFVVQLETEKILVQRRSGRTLWGLVRGYAGTTPARHLASTSITVLPRTDGFDVADFGAVGDGVTNDSAAFNAAAAFVAAVGGGTLRVRRATYRVADCYIGSNTHVKVDPDAVFKMPTSGVATTDPAVFRLLTSDRTLTTRIRNCSVVGDGGKFKIDFSDVSQGTFSGNPRGIHVLNCEDFRIENVEGYGFPGLAGNTVQIGANTGGTYARRGRLHSIISTGNRHVGNSAVQITGAQDIFGYDIGGDGGVPWRIEMDGQAGQIARNCHAYNVWSNADSGFGNTCAFFSAHTNKIIGCGVHNFRSEGGVHGVKFEYDSGGVISDCVAEDGEIVGGGRGVVVSSTVASATVSIPRCTVNRVNVTASISDGFDTADGLTYRDSWAYDCLSHGYAPGLNGSSKYSDTLAAGSRYRVFGGGAVRCGRAGALVDGVAGADYIGCDLRDTAARVAVSQNSNLVTNGAFETDVTGWSGVNSPTIARSTAQFHGGTASLLATATVSGEFSARTATGASGFSVVPGRTYQALAWVRAGSGTARRFSVTLRFYNSSGVQVGSDYDSTNRQALTAWLQGTVAAIAPATAAFATILIKYRGAAISDSVHIDDVEVRDVTTNGPATQYFGAEVATGVTAKFVACDTANNKTAATTGTGTISSV